MISPAARSQAVLRFQADLLAAWQPHVADARVVRHQLTHLIAAIVDDEELEPWIVLLQKAGNRVRHEAAPTAGRHDARDQRCRRHRRSHGSLLTESSIVLNPPGASDPCSTPCPSSSAGTP